MFSKGVIELNKKYANEAQKWSDFFARTRSDYDANMVSRFHHIYQWAKDVTNGKGSVGAGPAPKEAAQKFLDSANQFFVGSIPSPKSLTSVLNAKTNNEFKVSNPVAIPGSSTDKKLTESLSAPDVMVGLAERNKTIDSHHKAIRERYWRALTLGNKHLPFAIHPSEIKSKGLSRSSSGSD